MVAYSFKQRFVPLIESGVKAQTIRAHRRRHVRPGEPMQLYFGMRTKHCRKIIEDPTCNSVEVISIVVGLFGFGATRIRGDLLNFESIQCLAQDDGFEHVADMHAFWLKEHGEGKFEGMIIKW